jgi:hypothetical protein
LDPPREDDEEDDEFGLGSPENTGQRNTTMDSSFGESMNNSNKFGQTVNFGSRNGISSEGLTISPYLC